ncbi:MAG: serine hydrolase [Pseudomonadales bacterium]
MHSQQGRALTITALAVAIVAVTSILLAPKLQRLYLYATLTEPDRIVANFLHMEDHVEVHRVAPSSKPVLLQRSAATVMIPETFLSHGTSINTQAFLQQTGSTGMMILRGGAIAYQQYWQGMRPDSTHISYSVAKSFTSALIGIAIADGLIGSVDDPVTKYLPALANSGYANTTLADCLQMSSGTSFDENYAVADSDIFRYQKYFALGGSTAEFIGELLSERESGTYNKYNSMDAQVAGMVLRAALGERTVADYMQEKLWEPIGASHEAQWLIDSDDMELTLGGLNATLSDYARFGQLFLQRGNWRGVQVIPASWIALSTTPHAPHLLPGRDNPKSNKPYGYSYLWWTPIERFGDDFFASGIYNQFIYINPAKQMVIAKTSANADFRNDPEGYKEKYIDLFQAIAKAN